MGFLYRAIDGPLLSTWPLLEREVENPVVAAGPAYIWYDLKQIRARVDMSGFGMLMESLK